jgi:hypothetical protein
VEGILSFFGWVETVLGTEQEVMSESGFVEVTVPNLQLTRSIVEKTKTVSIIRGTPSKIFGHSSFWELKPLRFN